MVCGSNTKNNSIRSSLNCVGIPLTLGVFAALVATIAFISATTPQWMTGVTSALETEEKASLGRLSIAQAAYGGEIMGQMIAETNMITEYALQLFMTDGYTSPSSNAVNNIDPVYDMSKRSVANAADTTLPTGTWMWGYPFSAVEGILEVGTKGQKGQKPSTIVSDNSACTTTFKTDCWTEPEGRAKTELRDGTFGSTKTTMVVWADHTKTNINTLPFDLMEEIRISAYLEKVMSQIWFANPTAVSVYIGTERSGVMRQFPYAHQGTGLAKTRYKASALPPFSTAGGEEYYGYDPRKRPWYAEAKHNKKLIITAPYVYSTAPYPVGITVAMPILHPVTGELYGVIGFDVTVSLLEKVILSSSILYNGYAYLVNTEAVPVVYPCATLGAQDEETCTSLRCLWSKDRGGYCKSPDAIKIDYLEFGNDDETNKNNFNNELWSKELKLLKTGLKTFTKKVQGKDVLWHIAYAPIPVADYSLALVVPDSDIQLPATTVSNRIAGGIAAQIVSYIIATCVGLFIFILVLGRVSKGVVAPVRSLTAIINKIIKDLNRSKEDQSKGFRLNINEEIREEDEMCKEVSMMKQSFEYMVRALKFGKNAFAKNDLKAAEKVYQDALTMYQNLNNAKGIGIANFNLGATAHRTWLISDKQDDRAYLAAEQYYQLSISMARKQWQALNRADSTESGDYNSVTGRTQAREIVVNIEMPSREGKNNGNGRRTSLGPGEQDAAAIKGVTMGAVGHDIADRLSGRLYQKAQLYCDLGSVDAARAAEPLLNEALEWDEKTNNVLGYATRVGLLCKIMVILNRFQDANVRIESQLQILRRRLLSQEQMDEYQEGKNGPVKNTQPLRTRSMQERDQERDELFQALQHCLKDAAIVQGCSMGDDHLALRYFMESLSLSPRSEPYVINSIFRELGGLVDRGRVQLSPKLKEMLDVEVSKRGAARALPKDMAFVIDYSGSMSGGKMRKARSNTKKLMDSQLDAQDRGTVIQFNSRVDILTRHLVYKADPSLKRAVDSMTKPNSGTALWDGIGAALDQLDAEQGRLEREKWVIVLTDGEDNRSQANTPSSLSRRIRNGDYMIIILAVGVSGGDPQRNMQTVVDGNRSHDKNSNIGELISIDNSAELEKAFQAIASIIGDHVRVEQH